MAARVMLQRRSLAPLATLALGGIAFAPTMVFAEAPETYKRKPIYDDFEIPSSAPTPSTPVTTLPLPPSSESPENKPKGPTPTDRLAVQIGNARIFLYKYAVGAEDKLNKAMDSAFDLEQSFTNTIASLAPSPETGEKLLPGAIYVLVAAMAGSIITRNRNIILRASVPLALGIGAGWTVLPNTMRNVSDLAWQFEQKVPAVAESHIKVREALEKSASFARVHSRIGAQYVDDKVTDAREAVEGWVKKGK